MTVINLLDIADLENEVWTDVPDYEGYYQVSNLGRIKSLSREIYNSGVRPEKILKQNYDNYGYFRICLQKKGRLKPYIVSRLVAICFIPNPNNKPIVNHINGIKTDNRVVNLEWATASENVNHAINNNLFNYKKRGISTFKRVNKVKCSLDVKNKYKTYKVICPKTGDIVFIGFTKKTTTRVLGVFKNSIDLGKNDISSWFNSILKEGLVPKIEILMTYENREDAIKDYNIQILNHKNNGVNLLNKTLGIGSLGVPSGTKGRKHTDESKLKMSIANKGRKNTPEQIEKTRLKLIGRKDTLETRIKKSKSRIGKKHSEETRLKMDLSRKKTKLYVFEKDGKLSHEINSLREASILLNINYSTLKARVKKGEFESNNLIIKK